MFNATPEDSSNLLNGNPSSPNFGTTVGTVSEMSSDVVNFALFMRLLAPATPAPPNSSISNGQAWFSQIGCNLCHSPNLTTAASNFTGMSNVTYHPYSDFALHHMGAGLADGINQGAAGADQFRTAPLWGLGQRLFFLHDGRTTDLVQAIESPLLRQQLLLHADFVGAVVLCFDDQQRVRARVLHRCVQFGSERGDQQLQLAK